jgi:hypothetical protein
MTTSRFLPVLVCLTMVLAFVLIRRLTELPVRALSAGPSAGEDEVIPAFEVTALRIRANRIRAKDRIVRDLAAGRYSLLEAAAMFRELDHVPPEVKYPEKYPEVPFDPQPLQLVSPTEEERYCVAVIVYARNWLRGSAPEPARDLTERLVREFWAEQSERGEVRLPDAPWRAPSGRGAVFRMAQGGNCFTAFP